VLGDTVAEEYTGTTGPTDVARVLKSEYKMNKKIWKMTNKHAHRGVNTGDETRKSIGVNITPLYRDPRPPPQQVHAVGIDVAATHPTRAPTGHMRQTTLNGR
jgi:hypothetical protein